MLSLLVDILLGQHGSLRLAMDVLGLCLAPVFQDEFTHAMGLAIVEVAYPLDVAILPAEDAFAIVLAVPVVAFMRTTIIPINFSLAVDLVVTPVSFIDYFIFGLVDSVAMELTP